MTRPQLATIALILGAGASACGDKEDECLAICSGTLALTFADGREEFDAAVQGTGFSITATCPSEAYQGNVYGLEVACDGPTLLLTQEEANFPTELTVIVDSDRWDLTPDYSVEELCGLECESASVTLD